MCELCDNMRRLDRQIQATQEKLGASITLYRHCVADESIGASEAKQRAHVELDQLLKFLAMRTKVENELSEKGHGHDGDRFGNVMNIGDLLQ